MSYGVTLNSLMYICAYLSARGFELKALHHISTTYFDLVQYFVKEIQRF